MKERERNRDRDKDREMDRQTDRHSKVQRESGVEYIRNSKQ